MCRKRRTHFPADIYDEILGQKVTEVEEVSWETYGVCALHESNIFRKDSLYREIQHINNAYTVQWLRKPQTHASATRFLRSKIRIAIEFAYFASDLAKITLRKSDSWNSTTMLVTQWCRTRYASYFTWKAPLSCKYAAESVISYDYTSERFNRPCQIDIICHAKRIANVSEAFVHQRFKWNC